MCIMKDINATQLLLCLDNGETAVFFKDSKEAKFWLKKLKDEK